MPFEIPLETRLTLRTIRLRPWQPIIAAVTLAVAIGAMGLPLAAVYGAVLRVDPATSLRAD